MRPYLENWRAAVLFAAVITAAALTGITESLSLFQALSFKPLMISWLSLTVIAGLIAFRQSRHALAWPRVDLKTWFLSEKILLGLIVFVAGACGVTAIFGTPNTWDAMTYHLPRVEHWIQNRTVAFYPTNIIRQLYSTPWAEFAIAHARILGGGETSANSIQWIAMAGSLLGVPLIAGQLGANRAGQLLSAAVAACLPAGILEAVNTQNDYVCAFWLVVFVSFLIEAQRKYILVNIIAAGLSLGLAFLTKGSTYILVIPFLVWFVGANFKKRFVQGLLGLLLMLICALSLNMGQYWCNTQTFGSPMWMNTPLTNGSFDLKVLEGNILRNASIQLATPLMDVNEDMRQTIDRLAGSLGVDINDPRATYGENFTIHSMDTDEDYSGNFLHALLFVIVFVLSWFYRGPKGKINFYVGAVLSSFLLFCLIVRFQPWNSRFHLPLFILFCPVAGAVLEHFLKQKSVVLALVLAVATLPWLFLNDHHPWMGNSSIFKQPKPAQYFYRRPGLALPFVLTTGYLRSSGCQQIGLLTGEDSWEYPWWGLLAGQGVRIEHVGVSNASASVKYPLGDFQPCAIIFPGGQAPSSMAIGSSVYTPAIEVPGGIDKFTIFLRKP